jgi:ubiquinone biosynthesis protein UbiJ
MTAGPAFSIPDPVIKGFASLLEQVVERLPPPAWLANEAADRLVLLLNHVLQQESAATQRLERQAGRSVRAAWRHFHLRLRVTKAGLFERLPFDSPTTEGAGDVLARADDLSITLQDGPLAPILGAVAKGDKPNLSIEGDVQLAADINWLVDHVRWDIEEDLSRIIGDAPAHTLVGLLRSAWSKRPR